MSSKSSKKRAKFEESPASNGSAKHAKTDVDMDSAVLKHVKQAAVAAEPEDIKPVVVANGNAQPKSDASGVEEKLLVQQVMQQAQKSILERKKKLNIPTVTPIVAPVLPPTAPPANTKLAPGEAQHYFEMAMQKQTRAAELKAMIASRSSKIGSLSGTLASGSASSTAGVKALGLQPPQSLKANIRNEKREQLKQAQLDVQREMMQIESSASSVASSSNVPSDNTHFDADVQARPAMRQRRQLKFHDRGEFVQLANKQRAKAKLEILQSEISSVAKKTGISAAVKLAMAAPKATDSESRHVPDVEWWDAVLLPDDATFVQMSEEELCAAVDNDCAKLLSELVEHPIQLRPPDEPLSIDYLKVYLTQQERRKIRRQNRKEVQREKTEKIRLGLEPAPEPKMKISNLMRVLGTDAIKDPTKMEAHVRKQMQERLKKHEDANEARKLTKEQRSAKKDKKIREDVSLGVHVSVYRVFDLSNHTKKFKVEMNAKQLRMTGVVILHKDLNIVVVEGGPKQQKFYRKLMMHRIKWDEDIIKNDEQNSPNKCVLVWEGVVRKRAFGEIKFKACALEKQARELLDKYGAAHYWDMAYTGTVLAADDYDDLS